MIMAYNKWIYTHEAFITPNLLNIYTLAIESFIAQSMVADIPIPHHINACNQNQTIMKYGVNRVTLVRNVGAEPRVSEKEGEEVNKTEWHRIVNISGTFSSTFNITSSLLISGYD